MGRRLQYIRTTARLAAAVVVAASLSAVAQAPSTGAPSPASGDTLLDRHDETGKVGFIGTRAGRPIDSGVGPGATPGAAARTFVSGRAGSLGLHGSGLDVVETHRTLNRGTAVRLQQTHRGVPVLGGQFVVNLDGANDVLSVLGEASPITSTSAAPSTTPSVSAAAAERTSIASVAKQARVRPGALRAEPARLMFFDPRLLNAPGPYQHARLAWVTDVRGTGPTADIGMKVIVDAATGTVALSFETIAHAKDRSVCDADNSTAQVPCVAPVWTEGTTPGGLDADVQSAYDYAGDTYDFFFTRFGRDSLDDAGFPLVSTIDYCRAGSTCPYQNAFWNGSQMVYGDGFAAADDVVGHELTHGFTDFSSSLFYYMQSGAINESMSDVFGELIDLTNGSGTDTAAVRWGMGEDVPGFGVIRNMADPTVFGDPDRMLSPLYVADPNELDGGGVHTNSGVNNKAASLMVDGGTFNGQTITGIGITKTARLYYTVNNSMLVSGSDYADLANALRQACTNLVGTDGIAAADCAEVEKVVLATEMDQNPTSAPTASATACPTGLSVVATVIDDDLETDTGQFTTGAVAGTNAWSYPQNPNIVGGFDATYATSGVTNAWGYNVESASSSFIRMTSPVTVPADAYLTFNHAHGFEDDAGGAYDGGVVEYSTSGAGGPWTDAAALLAGPGGANGYNGTIYTMYGNPLAGRAGFVRESNGYGASRASLTSLAGQDVMLRWRIGTDSQYDDYGWFLDDIRIVTCAAPDVTPPDTTITSGPAEGSTTSDPTPTFAFTSSETGSTFECGLDGGAFAACTSPHTVSALPDGPHTFQVRATDAAANTDPSPASRAFTVSVPPPPPPDTTPPETTIASGPVAGLTTTDSTPTFEFGSTEWGSTFQCRVDEAAFVSCASPFTVATLADGSHTFEVRASDAAGNTDPTPASRVFTVDATAPDTAITAGPGGPSPTKDRTPMFGFSSTETGSTFECRLDAGEFLSCTSPFPTAALADGSHTFEVRATDAAGNADATPASRTFTVDATAPETTITRHPRKRTTSHQATFRFTAGEAGSSFKCRLDDRRWRSCSPPTIFRGLDSGRHVLRVYAIDAVGNADPTPSTWRWRIRG